MRCGRPINFPFRLDSANHLQLEGLSISVDRDVDEETVVLESGRRKLKRHPELSDCDEDEVAVILQFGRGVHQGTPVIRYGPQGDAPVGPQGR